MVYERPSIWTSSDEGDKRKQIHAFAFAIVLAVDVGTWVVAYTRIKKKAQFEPSTRNAPLRLVTLPPVAMPPAPAAPKLVQISSEARRPAA